MDEMTAKDFLAEAVPSLAGFSKGTISYDVVEDATIGGEVDDNPPSNGPVIVVDFTRDAESQDVATELVKIAPFAALDLTSGTFWFNFLTGEVSGDEATE